MYDKEKEELRRAYINEQNMREYQRNKRALNRINDAYGKYKKIKKAGKSLLNTGNNISSMGRKMSDFGNTLQKSNNPYLNQLGNKIGNAGTNTQNFGNRIQTTVNTRFSNTKPVPASSSAGVTQQPTSLLGKLQSGIGQKTYGMADAQNAQETAGSVIKNNLTNQLQNQTAGRFGVGGGTTNPVGSGLASSQTSSALPMGADNLSFVGQSAGNTVGTVGSGTVGTVGSTAGTTGAGTALGTTAGTTAGTAAGTTAGASAGAGAGATAAGGATAGAAGAASAVPVAGWILAAALAAKGMYDNYKGKQQSKAMQASQQATIDNQNISDEQTQNAMQDIANQAQQNKMNNNGQVMQTEQPTDTQQPTNEDRVAELMGLVNGGQQYDNNDEQDYYDSYDSLAQDNEGQITGGASGINQQQVANILNNAIQNQQGQQSQSPQAPQTTQATNTQQPTGGASPISLQQPQATQTQPQAQPQQLSGTVSQTQQPAFGSQVYQTGGGTGRISQLLDEYRKGYKDNTDNTLGNTYFAPGQQKTLANRIGELAGTGQRIASNPLVQGVIAGGIDYAMGNNLGNAALTGVNWARDKAASDRYEQLVNGNNKRSFLGGYSANDYKTKLDAERKQIQNTNDTNRANAYIDNINNQITNRDENTKLNKEKFQQKKENDDRNYGLKVQQFNYTKMDKDRNFGEKKRNNIANENNKRKPENHPDWNTDLANLYSTVKSGDEKKIDSATNAFIKKYGIDPRKKITYSNKNGKSGNSNNGNDNKLSAETLDSGLNSGLLVKIQAPNGEVRAVPRDQVNKYVSKGGKVIR